MDTTGFDFDPAPPDALEIAQRRLGVALKPLRALLTRAGGALAFDVLVFAALAALAVSLLRGAAGSLADEALYMLFGLVGFAVFWGSISGPDVARFMKLQRRWMREVRRAPAPAAPALRLQAPPPRLAAPLRPVAAQSAVRPQRHTGVSSLSLWRRSSR